MDSSFFLTTVAAAIALFLLLIKLRFDQDSKEEDSSSSSPSSSLTPSLMPPSSLSRIWTHHVFPSFRGEDVRRDFLSHILAEFQRMGITPFIDNDIRRGKSIGPELIRAIRESKIAVILLSRNYASSKWCLDELVEIMKCREELGQTVLAIFYKVDPSDIKKLTGDFGKVFRKTCVGRPKEDIGRWKQALEKVATVAGYHSSNWGNEAAMIKDIAIDISNILNNSTPSSDFDELVGMRVHLENLESLLCLDSDEVRMIGIWGPPGIGKTTIARVVYNQLSNCFQLSVFMEDIKANYASPCSDDYTAKLQLQQKFMSQITNHKDMEVSHLGVVRDRLKDKKVIVVLDGVDHLVQLDAMAKETWWFGPGSRILITAQDQKLFKAHGIKDIYKVDFPSTHEALEIFCMSAFRQKFPENGFEELAWKVTQLVGKLPLGLRVMGSYFRGMSQREWTESLPRLETSLDEDIQSVLKFSYDALDDKNRELFLYIACFFNYHETTGVEEHLGKVFVDVRLRLRILAEKSLISFGYSESYIEMHSLLVKLGREIVRKQYIHDPGQRQFLVGDREICEVLTGDAAGSKSVVGIDSRNYLSPEQFVISPEQFVIEELDMSERAFEGMSNLQFLRLGHNNRKLPRGLNYISRKLQLLEWRDFPMTYLPSIVNVECLVELIMPYSKLEKLWDGIKRLPNLKRMDLSDSVNLKEVPDLSTATNLERLDFSKCSSLLELPLSIGNLQKLQKLILEKCSKLEVLPTNINLESLEELDLTDCSKLKSFPEISTNVKNLKLTGTAIEEVPPSINSWPCLVELCMSKCKNLKGFSHTCKSITEIYLSDTKIEEVPPFSSLQKVRPLQNLRIMDFSAATNLQSLDLSGCSNLQELPSTIENATDLKKLDLSYCPNLVELPRSIENLQKLEKLRLEGCSKLEILPTNINLRSLDKLDLTDCSMLKIFPEISTNVRILKLSKTAIEEVPLSIGSWPRLDELEISYFENLKEFPHALDIITGLELSDTEIQEVPSCVKRMSRLELFMIKGCRKLVSLPQFPDSLSVIYAEGCESLERLDCSFSNPLSCLYFAKCFNLNQEARDLIIHTRTSSSDVFSFSLLVLPGREVPLCFIHRATCGDCSVTIKLNEGSLSKYVHRVKAFIWLFYKGDDDTDGKALCSLSVTCKKKVCCEAKVFREHLYAFEAEVNSCEVVFEFEVKDNYLW